MDFSIQISKCSVIYELFQSDVYLFDSEDRNIYSLTSSSRHPQFFKKYIDNDIKKFLQHIKASKSEFTHYYNSSYFFCFIGISLWEAGVYTGSVIMGPFLEDNFNLSHFTSRYSSQLQAIGTLDTLSSFYKDIPIYSYGKPEKLIALLYNFFVNPFLQQSTNYINNLNMNSYEIVDPINTIDDSTYWKLHHDEERQLVKSIAEGNVKETMRILEKMKLNNTSQSDAHSIKRLKDLLTMANSNLARAAIKNKVPLMISYTLSAKFGREIERVSNLSEYNRLSTQLFKAYVELIGQYSSTKYSYIINEAISIIDRLSQESITLMDIAKELHVSSAHLSRKFKAETKMTITEYIHKAKIDTAIELMKLSRYSLFEISQSIGYINYSHFNKWFKKFTGVSPKFYQAEDELLTIN